VRKQLLIIVFGLVLALGAPPAFAATAFVQGTSGSTSGASLSVSYPSSIQPGALLVGQVRANGITTVSDSVNGAWTQAVQTTDTGVTHSIWYKQNAKAGSTTVTVKGATAGTLRAVIAAYSGVATSNALDQGVCNKGTAAVVTTGATASIAAGDLLFAGVGAYDEPLTATAGSSDGVSATLRTQFTGSNGTSADEDVGSTAAGPQNASFTLSATALSGWAACAAAFHPAAPMSTSAPVISGTPQEGDTLTATPGSWSNGPTSYAYAWQRCTSSTSCSNISGATSSTYTLQTADLTDTIHAVVTASNPGGQASATSAATVPILIFDGIWPASGPPSMTVWSGPGTGTNGSTVVGALDPLWTSSEGVRQDVGYFAVQRGDINPCCTYAGRADFESPEVMSPTQNSDVYVSIPVYLPMGTVTDLWNNRNDTNSSGQLIGANSFMVNESYGPPYDGSPAAGSVNVTATGPSAFNFNFAWDDVLGTYDPAGDSEEQWISPTITTAGWHTIIQHIHWSPGASTGYEEIWFDGVPQQFTKSQWVCCPGAPPQPGLAGANTRIYFSNFNSNNNGAPNFTDDNLYGNMTTDGSTLTVYHGETTIGTTLASVAPYVNPHGP
jgi:hypothetical protein